MSFWDLLRPPAGAKATASRKPATAAELTAALAEAELAAAEAEQDAADAARARAELLLEADDKRLDAAERRLQLAQREADRAAAAAAALQERAREAEERERRECLDDLYAEGTAALRAGIEAYAAYGRLARQMVDPLLEMYRRHEQIQLVRRRLRDAGDPRTIPDLDDAARPQTNEPRFILHPLWSGVRLPHATDPLKVLFPPGTDTFGLPAPVDEERAK